MRKAKRTTIVARNQAQTLWWGDFWVSGINVTKTSFTYQNRIKRQPIILTVFMSQGARKAIDYLFLLCILNKELLLFWIVELTLGQSGPYFSMQHSYSLLATVTSIYNLTQKWNTGFSHYKAFRIKLKVELLMLWFPSFGLSAQIPV